MRYFSFIKEVMRKFRLLLRRLNLCLGVILTGYQLTIGEFLYSYWHNRARPSALKRQGYIFRSILSEPLYHKLCNEAKYELDKSINEIVIHENINPWVLNKRHYADLSLGTLKTILDEIKLSPSFNEFIKESLGESSYEITAQAIWRNYSEGIDNLSKIPQEVNSTFFHVDNGGDIKDRLHLNLFLYLGDVVLENGPFTFYDIKTSRVINRKFISTIFKRLNLRTFELVEKIEKLYPVNRGYMKKGEALIIDNQKCLHRAGFCVRGHRDILELVFRKQM